MGRIPLKYLIFQFFLITVTPQVFVGTLEEQCFCLLKMTKGNSGSMGRNNAAWIFPKWMFSWHHKYNWSRHASLKALTRSFSGVVLTPESKHLHSAKTKQVLVVPMFDSAADYDMP